MRHGMMCSCEKEVEGNNEMKKEAHSCSLNTQKQSVIRQKKFQK